ncbi:hypothetical protein [Asanoa sp. NPDC050611]
MLRVSAVVENSNDEFFSDDWQGRLSLSHLELIDEARRTVLEPH